VQVRYAFWFLHIGVARKNQRNANLSNKTAICILCYQRSEETKSIPWAVHHLLPGVNILCFYGFTVILHFPCAQNVKCSLSLRWFR